MIDGDKPFEIDEMTEREAWAALWYLKGRKGLFMGMNEWTEVHDKLVGNLSDEKRKAWTDYEERVKGHARTEWKRSDKEGGEEDGKR